MQAGKPPKYFLCGITFCDTSWSACKHINAGSRLRTAGYFSYLSKKNIEKKENLKSSKGYIKTSSHFPHRLFPVCEEVRALKIEACSSHVPRDEPACRQAGFFNLASSTKQADQKQSWGAFLVTF